MSRKLPIPDPPRCPQHPDYNSKVLKSWIVRRADGERVRKRLCRCRICRKILKQTVPVED